MSIEIRICGTEHDVKHMRLHLGYKHLINQAGHRKIHTYRSCDCAAFVSCCKNDLFSFKDRSVGQDNLTHFSANLLQRGDFCIGIIRNAKL